MTIQFSGRSAADWVRGYAETLRDPVASLPTWQATVDQEWAEYRGDPRQMERSLLRDLIRWHVDLLYETGRQAEAISTMESSLTLVDPSPPEVLETIDWLLTREAWSVIDLTYERFGEVCQGNPELVYRMAEVRLKQGRPDEADQLAAEARAIDPQKLQNHDILARALRERGMIDWAEAEYRYMLEEVEENSVYDVWFRYSFADMLHDQLRDGEAAEALEPAVEALRDPAVAASLQNISLTPDTIICRAHYFSACHFEQLGDLEKQASHLQVAIARNPADLDTLIALYNMPEEDERRRRQTLDYLERTRETIGQRLSLIEQRLEQETHQPHIEAYEAALAQQCNQYAWLVSNTEGDFEEALRVSERSLEIIADGPMRGGYLDTLAHCHAALEDYEQAVAVQQEAVALEPHSGLLQRELELFQAALAKQNAAATGE